MQGLSLDPSTRWMEVRGRRKIALSKYSPSGTARRSKMLNTKISQSPPLPHHQTDPKRGLRQPARIGSALPRLQKELAHMTYLVQIRMVQKMETYRRRRRQIRTSPKKSVGSGIRNE